MSKEPVVCTVPRTRRIIGGAVPPSIHPQGAAMFSAQAWDAIARRLQLSARELQAAQGAFDDSTESKLAADLKVSPHTIHTHYERLYTKLHVTDRVRLVLCIVDAFLVLTSVPKSALPAICGWRTDGRCPLNRRRPRKGSGSGRLSPAQPTWQIRRRVYKSSGK